jgi:PAS domain-containing protein
MARDTTLTGVERMFDDDEIIVSKTDLKGHITYANNVFLRLADMTEKEALGAPHSVIRNPEMPRAVFKLLWDNRARKFSLTWSTVPRTATTTGCSHT